MSYERKPKPNEMPYLLDFARNIGFTQKQLAYELDVGETTISPWALGKLRPLNYEYVCPKLKEIIANKLESDIREWEEYLNESQNRENRQ